MMARNKRTERFVIHADDFEVVREEKMSEDPFARADVDATLQSFWAGNNMKGKKGFQPKSYDVRPMGKESELSHGAFVVPTVHTNNGKVHTSSTGSAGMTKDQVGDFKKMLDHGTRLAGGGTPGAGSASNFRVTSLSNPRTGKTNAQIDHNDFSVPTVRAIDGKVHISSTGSAGMSSSQVGDLKLMLDTAAKLGGD